MTMRHDEEAELHAKEVHFVSVVNLGALPFCVPALHAVCMALGMKARSSQPGLCKLQTFPFACTFKLFQRTTFKYIGTFVQFNYSFK